MVVTTALTSLPQFPILKFHQIKPRNQSSLSLPLPLPPRLHHIPRAPRATPISATSNVGFLISEATPAENSDQVVSEVVSGNGDGISIVISVLLSVAFVGLSVLTIGVIYIAVTDYLQKREKEKFEKDEAEKAKKGGKKKRVRAKAGPKGFGQKIDIDDDL